jgi:hypothetical protein
MYVLVHQRSPLQPHPVGSGGARISAAMSVQKSFLKLMCSRSNKYSKKYTFILLKLP